MREQKLSNSLIDLLVIRSRSGKFSWKGGFMHSLIKKKVEIISIMIMKGFKFPKHNPKIGLLCIFKSTNGAPAQSFMIYFIM